MKNKSFIPYPEEYSKAFLKAIISSFEHFFEQSPQHPLFMQCYYSVESYHLHRRYRWYRIKQLTWKKLAPKRSSSHPASLTRLAFAATYYPPTAQQLWDAGLAGLRRCLTDSFPYSCTLYHSVEKRFHLLCHLSHDPLIERTFREYFPQQDEDYWEELDASEHWIWEDNDPLLSLYEFVFKEIKKAGLDWEYRSVILADTKRLSEFNEEDENINFLGKIGISLSDPEEDLLPIHPDDVPAKPMPTFEEEYFRELQSRVPSAVKAYTQVYGRLPDGYPPRIDEY